MIPEVQSLSTVEYSFRSLFENASVGILAVDSAGQIVDANALLLRLVGYASAELIGSSVDTLLPEAFRAAHKQHRVEYVANPRVRQMGLGFDLTARRKDGTNIPVEISLSYAQGITLAFVSDISARKLIEQERESLIKRLQAALDEKVILIKEVHHRIKNNLAVVAGLLSLQAQSINDDKLTTALEESQRRVASIALVHEYLYASDRLDLINLGSYLRKLVNELASTYTRYGSQSTVTLSLDDIELPVDYAIPCGLIVNELVSNAFKHAFPDSRRGEISLALRSFANGDVVLSCRDNGVGLDETRVRRTPPSLGLEIVRMLVLQIEGEFTQDTAHKQGAAFEIRFHGKTPSAQARIVKPFPKN